MKNIAFINSHIAWGGGEKWHLDNALAINNEYNVTLISHPESELFKKANNKLKCIPFSSNKFSFLNPFIKSKVKLLFRNNNFDTIILNLPSDLKLFAPIAKKHGINNIIYRRGSAIKVNSNKLNKYLYGNILDLVISNSQATLNLIIGNNDDLNIKDKSIVLYNGIKSDGINISKKELDKNKIIIGNAGRLDKQKGQAHLFDLNNKLNLNSINNRILIAGTGKLESDLKALIKNNSDIKFLGFQQDLNEFYNSIDVFVLTSHWEGFGFVIAEAMLRGIPVIAFNISSNPELIQDGVNGYLIDPFNIDQMADKIEHLTKNPNLIKEMGLNGRKFIIDNFDFDQQVSKLKDLL